MMTNADGRDGKISLQKRRWRTFTDATIRTHNPEGRWFESNPRYQKLGINKAPGNAPGALFMEFANPILDWLFLEGRFHVQLWL